MSGEAGGTDITATMKPDGSFDIQGVAEIDLAKVAPGYAEGTVKAAGGSKGGLSTFLVSGAKITKAPFDVATIKTIAYNKAQDHLEVDVDVKADKLSFKGLTVGKLDAGIHLKKSGGVVGFDGHVKGDVDFSPGGTKVGAGSLIPSTRTAR